MKRLGLARAASLVLGLWLLFESTPALSQAPCYMAFIHGSGDKFHDEDPSAP